MKKDFYVLIVEDEEAIANHTKKMLEDKCPFITKLEIVENGELGLKKIKQEMPDFIILNQYMPKMTGLEMIEECTKLNLKLPTVIVMTGGMKDEERKRFNELGIEYIFTRTLNEFQIKYFLHFVKESYQRSTKIAEEDMTEIISRQTNVLYEEITEIPEPISVSLVAYVIRHLVKNDMEYKKETKDELYNYFKEQNKLSDKMIKEIREKIEILIKYNYCQGNPIRKLNYQINKDDIEYEFFHNLKENVLKDIIAESN